MSTESPRRHVFPQPSCFGVGTRAWLWSNRALEVDQEVLLIAAQAVVAGLLNSHPYEAGAEHAGLLPGPGSRSTKGGCLPSPPLTGTHTIIGFSRPVHPSPNCWFTLLKLLLLLPSRLVSSRRQADLNATDRRGLRPIHLAAMSGMSESVAALLNAGVPVDTMGAEANTALH
ncbi:unnamed protein product, partial [Ectocarpus sp. 13 AM-2016]